MQRVLGLRSAEDVLMHATALLAKALTSDPLTCVAMGADQLQHNLQQQEREAREDQHVEPPKIGTNLGDKLRDAGD